ncbi:YcfL family protein [Shewanella gaetbuli]|uniref:YcfL family protein n=1 Tax=Shewanella gaetbuli TaxID=220752 RepID=A0A9X1ZUE2_9GAMM|nr:YcfL family protein [Shewanella gaetbuli]MCL1144298.1 YcfL family protein [Shewanella gaetbuli]
MKQLACIMFTAAMLLGGCANHTAGIAVNSQGEVRVDNNTFAREVSVSNVNARQSADLLQGAAQINSLVATDLRLQYKFTWYDAAGFTIEDEASSWKALKLHGKQQIQVSGVAPNANASRFEVYVRKAFSN